MSVGLYDADFFKYHQTIFNLEIMKLSTYFKKKREITIMAPSFIPERYSSFFYRKDYNDGDFPLDLNQWDNLTYGGLAFTNNRYIPLKEEIERCVPDTSIYNRYKDLFIEDSVTNQTSYTTLSQGIHFRLSLNGTEIWKDFEKQIPSQARGKVFFLHDYNLNNITSAAENVQEIIQKYRISEKNRTSLCCKFPIICFDFNTFQKWLSFVFSSLQFSLQYNGIFKDEELNEIVTTTNQTKSAKIIYNPLPSSYEANDFLESDLIKIFTHVLFLYRNEKQFLLTCNDSFQVPREIKKMFWLFTAYCRSTILPKPTSLFYFVKELRQKRQYKTEIITQPEAIEVFSYVQKNYPNLFPMFYENSGAIFEGGKLRID